MLNHLSRSQPNQCYPSPTPLVHMCDGNLLLSFRFPGGIPFSQRWIADALGWISSRDIWRVIDLHNRRRHHWCRRNSGKLDQTLFETVNSFVLKDGREKSFGTPLARCVRQKFEEVAADAQKFPAALRWIHASNPTGVTEAEGLSMAIVNHLGKCDGMNYDPRDFPHRE